jgi:MFS family permease
MSFATRRPLVPLSLALLMCSLDTSIANAALPALARAFDAPFRSTQWIVLAYLAPLTVFTLFAGRLGDVAGRRRLLVAGIGTFTVASFVCGLAVSLPMLLAARALQGLGAAAMMALAVALAADLMPARQTGRAMGLLGSMSAVGTTLGPSLGGLLTAFFGWPSIFLVNVPVGLLTLYLTLRHVPDPLAAAAPAVQAESARVRPLGGLAAPGVRGALSATALVATVMMTTLVVGPFHLAGALGLGDAAAGVVLSIGPLVAVAGGVPAGRIVDRFGAARMTRLSLMALAVGAAWLSLMPRQLGLAGYIAPIVDMTASYALFQAANNTRLMSLIERRHRSAAAGALGLARNAGLIAGASVMGAIFAWAAGLSGSTAATPDAIAAGTHVTFRVAAMLAVAAFATTLVSPNPKGH